MMEKFFIWSANDQAIQEKFDTSTYFLFHIPRFEYCQAQGHSETSNVPKKQLNEN